MSEIVELDDIDRRLLRAVQRDAGATVESLAEIAGLSRNACWRRLKRLEETGVILRRVALLDADKVGRGLTVFIAVRCPSHAPDWLESFARAVRRLTEIEAAYRMTGDLDYLIKARVRDVGDYDRLYQRLIREVALGDVSASFVMEAIRETTEIAL